MSSLSSMCDEFWGIRFRKALGFLRGTIGALLFCLPLFSQANFGRIMGTVTDQSGGVVAGAAVTVLDTQRGVSKHLVANDAGEYNAPNLSPGTYIVRAEAKGFKVFERQNIVLEVGKEIRVDATLQPGDQTQTVTVTESIPLVDTTNATLGGTLDNKDINELPLNGRNYQNLLGLRPGVMLQPGGGPWTQSTNGIRPDEVAWNIDGILNANFFDSRPVINMPSPFSDAATILPVDAIQEFNLEENPKAEWGWKPGAVVNVGIKSGTNVFHGTAYGFYRSAAWDARNYFNPAPANGACSLNVTFVNVCNKIPAQLKQFGGTVGGPIKKDKLFFFAGYEGLRSRIGNVFPAPGSVPLTAAQTPANPTNSMVDAIIALQNAGVNVSPVSLALTGCPSGTLASTSMCTGGLYTGASPSSTNFLSTFPNTNISDNGVAKIDYHVNSKHTINGMFFLGNYTSNGEDHPFLNQAFTDNAPIRAWTTVENWIWTPNSTLVNELRFGYTRTDFNFVNVDVGKPADGSGLTGGAGYPINTGVTNPLAGGLPNIWISTFGAPTGGPALGTALNRPQYFSPNPVYNFTESVSYLKGKHSLKFGGEYMHIEAESGVFVAGRGVFVFNGGSTPGHPGFTPLEDFFAGNPSSGQLLSGNASLKTTWKHYAGYVQDDWRIDPKLTLNLGLRYEYHSPIKESNGLLASFDPAKGMVQQGKQIDTLWNASPLDFAPRLGLAWDITGKGTTVVRGGFSIIYSTFVLESFLGQFALQNSGSTSPAAIPTAATLVNTGCVSGVASGTCTPIATTGGTIGLQTASFTPSQLNWDSKPGLNGGTALPTATATCGDGIGLDPSPCNIMGVDPNLRDPYIMNWNFGIQHAFTNNLSLEVGYVGNHGSRLFGIRDINQAPLGAGWCQNSPLTAAQIADACKLGPTAPPKPFNSQAAQEARPYFNSFPYLGFINWASNNVHSNFNSLQVTLTQRASHGLSFTAGYTFAHGLDNGSLNRFGLLPQNSNNTGAEYGSSDFDIRQRFTLTTTYNIPGVKGYGQLLQGWQVNSIYTYQTAQPWSLWDGGNNFDGTGENAYRWDLFGSPDGFRSSATSIPFCNGFGVDPVTLKPTTVSVSCSQQAGTLANSTPLPKSLGDKCATLTTDPNTLKNAGCYVTNNGVIVPAPLNHFGNMGRNIFRDSGFKNWDLSVFKNFTFKEQFSAQLRVELFNVLNHPNIANPYGASNFGGIGDTLNSSGTFGCGCGTPDVIAGNNLIGSGSARVMQVGLKLKF